MFIGRLKKNRLGMIQHRAIQRDTQKILDEVGLHSIKPTDIVRRMSAAQMQMVEIAKAISTNSDVIVFDEPDRLLDRKRNQNSFWHHSQALLRRARASSTSPHRMEELKEIADMVTILRDGQKIGESFRFADKTLDELIKMMVGRELKDKYPVYERKIGDVLLSVDNVKSEKLNVDHIEVRRGEIVGLSGLMGAGRTELARAIFGADRTQSIEITLDGKKVVNHSPSDSIAHGITYLTEDRKREGLALRMNCEQNINMSSWGHVLYLRLRQPRQGQQKRRNAARALPDQKPPRCGRWSSTFPAATSRRSFWPRACRGRRKWSSSTNLRAASTWASSMRSTKS